MMIPHDDDDPGDRCCLLFMIAIQSAGDYVLLVGQRRDLHFVFPTPRRGL